MLAGAGSDQAATGHIPVMPTGPATGEDTDRHVEMLEGAMSTAHKAETSTKDRRMSNVM